MARKLIQRYKDTLIRAVAPKNQGVDPNTVLNDAASASGSFKVYDTDKDEVISVDEASGQTVLNVTNVGVFTDGETVEITQDDATLITTTISNIDAVAGTITVADVLTDDCAAGNRVRRIFGSEITMDEYGTADLDTRDWGYEKTFSDTHPAHLDTRAKTGLDIDIEIIVDGGAGIKGFDVICATIKQKDCG